MVGEIFSISIAFVAANVTLQFNGTEVDRTYYLLHRRDIIVVQRFTKESRVDSYKCLLHTSLSPHQHKCRKLKCPIRSRKMVIAKHSRSRWCVELLVSQQYRVSWQYETLGVTNVKIYEIWYSGRSKFTKLALFVRHFPHLWPTSPAASMMY